MPTIRVYILYVVQNAKCSTKTMYAFLGFFPAKTDQVYTKIPTKVSKYIRVYLQKNEKVLKPI